MVFADEFGPTIINYPSDAGGERIVSNPPGYLLDTSRAPRG